MTGVDGSWDEEEVRRGRDANLGRGATIDGDTYATQTPRTAGISTASPGTPLDTLQFAPCEAQIPKVELPPVWDAACKLTHDRPATKEQARRNENINRVLAEFLTMIVQMAPPGPERSTAISRAREAKMWASAAIALEESR